VLAGSGAAAALTPAEAQALDLLAAIDPDALTPREALDALYRLKAVSVQG
jgi:DNA mismatch repair protein MutS